MNVDIKAILLERRIITDSGCWLYTGGKFSNGYGSIKYKGKTHAVHRLSLSVFKDIIFGVEDNANHIKECPNKHCFNPDHLYKGTQIDNMADRHSKCESCGIIKEKPGRCMRCKRKYMKKYMRDRYRRLHGIEA